LCGGPLGFVARRITLFILMSEAGAADPAQRADADDQ
jgi:hypothetical protein